MQLRTSGDDCISVVACLSVWLRFLALSYEDRLGSYPAFMIVNKTAMPSHFFNLGSKGEGVDNKKKVNEIGSKTNLSFLVVPCFLQRVRLHAVTCVAFHNGFPLLKCVCGATARFMVFN